MVWGLLLVLEADMLLIVAMVEFIRGAVSE